MFKFKSATPANFSKNPVSFLRSFEYFIYFHYFCLGTLTVHISISVSASAALLHEFLASTDFFDFLNKFQTKFSALLIFG